MLEKIGRPEWSTLSRPNESVLRYAHEVQRDHPDLVFYEIGVGIGATSLPVAQLLDNRGSMYLFSRENDVKELAQDLRNLGYTNVDDSWGSPNKVYSGYHFELARGVFEKKLPPFDLAYVDGGHVFHLDAPATCLLKELCKPGGYMIFDDWGWSLASSPTMNPTVRPQTAKEYDDKQIAACHVQLVCNVFMESDPRFESLGRTGNTAIYRRRAS
jgi:SAM-dependent methyltransferase